MGKEGEFFFPSAKDVAAFKDRMAMAREALAQLKELETHKALLRARQQELSDGEDLAATVAQLRENQAAVALLRERVRVELDAHRDLLGASLKEKERIAQQAERQRAWRVAGDVGRLMSWQLSLLTIDDHRQAKQRAIAELKRDTDAARAPAPQPPPRGWLRFLRRRPVEETAAAVVMCGHERTEEVATWLSDEVVAHLCLVCSAQLPAGWGVCPHPYATVAEYAGKILTRAGTGDLERIGRHECDTCGSSWWAPATYLPPTWL